MRGRSNWRLMPVAMISSCELRIPYSLRAPILDDYSRYIIAWKLCTYMPAEDVTEAIELALAASGCDQAVVRHKPSLLSDNGP